jgi:hypothetical protein
MAYQMTLLRSPAIFTTPASDTRYYFTATPGAVINGTAYILDAYSDPDTDNTALQPQTYVGYSIDPSGAVTQANAIADWINAYSPQAIPKYSLNYQLRSFNGPASSDVAGAYFDTVDGVTGAATFRVAAIDLSSASPIVHQVGTSITVNPVSKTLSDNITAELANLANGNSLDEQIFEVEGAPAVGEVQGTFMIFDANGNVVVAPRTGFHFTDGKAHSFGVGPWNKTGFAQLTEVWNTNTSLADLQLSVIDASTGVVSAGWTAATELQNISRVSWVNLPNRGGMIVLADGADAGGRGFFEYLVDDSTKTGGTGGSIINSLAVHYQGTVTQDARIHGSGVQGEYVVDWVDGNGLSLELVDSNLNVLAAYNVPEANGTSTVTQLDNGNILVSYRVAGASGANINAVNKAVVLGTQTSLWAQIDGGSPKTMIAGDFSGSGRSELAAAYAGAGTYTYSTTSGWTKIDNGVPDLMASGDFAGLGHAQLVGVFGGYGTYTYSSGAGWSKIDNGTPSVLTSGDYAATGHDQLAGVFAGYGTYTWSAGDGWQKIDNGNPNLLASGDFHGTGHAELAGVFAGYGTYTWAHDAGWLKIDDGTPTQLVAGDFDHDGKTELAGYFAGYGTYIWSETAGWSKIDGGAAAGLASVDLLGNGQSELEAYFPGAGVYEWQHGIGWSNVNGALPTSASQVNFSTGNFNGGSSQVAAVTFAGQPGVWLDPPAGASASMGDTVSGSYNQSGSSANLALLGHYMASSFPSGVASNGSFLSDAGQMMTPHIVPPHSVG